MEIFRMMHKCAHTQIVCAAYCVYISNTGRTCCCQRNGAHKWVVGINNSSLSSIKVSLPLSLSLSHTPSTLHRRQRKAYIPADSNLCSLVSKIRMPVFVALLHYTNAAGRRVEFPSGQTLQHVLRYVGPHCHLGVKICLHVAPVIRRQKGRQIGA